jgi:GxxExxY protein
MHTDKNYLHSEITDKILKAYYTVRNSIPNNLSLEFFDKAMEIEMFHNGMKVERDIYIPAKYRDKKIGDFIASVLVNEKVVLKYIYAEGICEQCIGEMKNLLRYSEFEVGLILNFFPDEGHRRIVFTNELKKL